MPRVRVARRSGRRRRPRGSSVLREGRARPPRARARGQRTIGLAHGRQASLVGRGWVARGRRQWPNGAGLGALEHQTRGTSSCRTGERTTAVARCSPLRGGKLGGKRAVARARRSTGELTGEVSLTGGTAGEEGTGAASSESLAVVPGPDRRARGHEDLGVHDAVDEGGFVEGVTRPPDSGCGRGGARTGVRPAGCRGGGRAGAHCCGHQCQQDGRQEDAVGMP